MGSPTEAADMQAAAAAALLAIASGLVAADGVDHGDHGAQHGTVLASEPLAAQPVDNSNYYNYKTDTFAPTGSDGFYDPYASNFLTQEQDRTDGGVIGGLTIGVLLPLFLDPSLLLLSPPQSPGSVPRSPTSPTSMSRVCYQSLCSRMSKKRMLRKQHEP